MNRTRSFTIVGIWFGLILVFALYAFVTRDPYTPPTCKDYADTPMRDVPARCLDYWK